MSVLLLGITLGAIYALVALGYTLVYGIIELINFANGDVFMLGTMVTITVSSGWLGLNGSRPGTRPSRSSCSRCSRRWSSAPRSTSSIERIAYRPLRNAPKLAPLITAIGMSFLLQNIGAAIWGFNERPLTSTGASIFPANTLFKVGRRPVPGQVADRRPDHHPGAARCSRYLVAVHEAGQGDAGGRPGHGRQPR